MCRSGRFVAHDISWNCGERKKNPHPETESGKPGRDHYNKGFLYS